MSRIIMGMLLVSVAAFIAGCAATGGAAPPESYRLAHHQPGTMQSSYVPGYGGRKGEQVTAAIGGWSIFEKDGLIYFVERGQLTVYKPREGLLVRLPLNMASVKEDVDGTKNINFVRASDGGGTGLRVFGLVHPEHIQTWDNAAKAPGPWFGSFSLQASQAASRNWMMVGSKFRGEEPFVQGLPIPPSTAGSSKLERSENFLRATSSTAAVPMLADARARASGYDEREAQKRAAIQQRAREADARRAEIQRSAEVRFLSAAAVTKEVGMSVCSADNRFAFIEQVAGQRLKLLVKGKAMAVYGEFGELGPYGLVEPAGRIAMPEQPLPIEDAHFLFRPLTKQVRFTNENQPLWDETQFWGACSFR